VAARRIQGEFATVVDVLRAAAVANAAVEAYVEPGTESSPRRHLTFAGWDRAADGVAGLLADHGVTRGSVVCLLLPSSIDYMVCYAAATRLGAVTSGVNLRLGRHEVGSILERTRPAVTVVDDDAPVPEGPAGVVLRRSEAAAAGAAVAPGAHRGGIPRPELQGSDPVAVVWTSGTTGLPKGAVFDHRNLAAVAAGTDVLSETGDRRLSPLPFAHVGSMTRTWDEIAHGVTTVITPTPWRAGDAISIMAGERITVAQGVPTQWSLVLAHPDLGRADLSSLRIAGTGASRVPPELVAEMRARLGVPVVVRYTSTEASLGTGTVPGDPDPVVAATVGRPVPGVSLEVADDRGRPVGGGEVGRVRLRSPAVMRGYWGGPTTGPGAGGVRYDVPATRAVLAGDGWLTTGDFGFVDESGYLHLAGRANELYIRGGYNVYPAEVEAVLGAHPTVDQVAVIGVPDPVLGEIGVAFVVPAGDARIDPEALLSELRAVARASLADYKAPDRLVLVDSFPLTSMMKVDKRRLAEQTAPLPTTGPGPGILPSTGPGPAHHQATHTNGAHAP
jgi:acyl-CoA synthetase (AMP-forming)/AMP-acid ligase II